MDARNAIEVRNVTKKFKIFLDKGNTIKERMLFSRRRKYEDRHVLKGISFDVKKGEAIGLIGHNGCGKSTTLKLLTKIIYPDTGSVEIKGRVSSLIELGAGFHPDLSGRENIYINASIFGLNRKEIDRRLDDIIAFSELEEFIDNPVRTYSSGMYMRLAFSVAINVDAEVLLIDEILAVGDAAFQAKCFNRLKEIKSQGTTIVIVSHSLGQIEEICDRSIWIHEGYIKAEGEPEEVHEQYLEYVAEYRQQISAKEAKRNEMKEEEAEKAEKENKDYTDDELAELRKGSGTIKIKKVKAYNEKNVVQTIFKTGERMDIEIQYEVNEKEEEPILAIGILRYDGTLCYSTNTKIEKFIIDEISKSGKIKVILEELNLLPDLYCMDIAFWNSKLETIDYKSEAYKFEMISNIPDSGVARIKHKWIMEE